MSTKNLVANSKTIHFIGIGGIGMSALAQIYLHQDKIISGSDLNSNSQTLHLQEKGATIFNQHSENNIQFPDLIIASLAINQDNPEIQKAKQLNIPILTYPQALGQLSEQYKLIAIAGTHGKTTTTGMLAKILIDNNLDPTVIVGSTVDFLNNQNYRIGESNLLLLEACEYKAGFLNLNPDITLITNLEHDHFDAYPSAEEYLTAFNNLINNSKKVFLNTDLPLSQQIRPSSKITTFNSKNNPDINLSIPGIHNRTNAHGAILVSQALNTQNPEISLQDFNGTGRRLQILKQTPTQIIYDDYGHHPTEIQATFQALQEKHPNQDICLIFQPHQYSRTIALLNDFQSALKPFTKIIIPDIFEARDTQEDKNLMPPSKFANLVNAIHLPEIYTDPSIFKEETQNYPIIIIMGAGDISAKLQQII